MNKIAQDKEFRDVPGYEGLYRVSNTGTVESSVLIERNKLNGKSPYLAKCYDCHGYIRPSLRKNKIATGFPAHRLVAMAFLPNPLNLPQVNHINGIKDDNRVENLEWVNNSQNMKHAYKTGLRKRNPGSKSPRSTITEETAIQIYLSTDNARAAAKKFNTTMSIVHHIRLKQCWKHIHPIKQLNNQL